MELVYLFGKNENSTDEESLLEKQLGAVVPKLMSDLFGLGYKLFVNNWYTSEKLFNYLQDNNTAACGTARSNRLKLPKSF